LYLNFFSLENNQLGKNKGKTRKASWSVRIKEAQGISQSDRENHILKRPKTYVSETERSATQHLGNSLGESHRNLDDTIQWKGKSKIQVRQLNSTEKKNSNIVFNSKKKQRKAEEGTVERTETEASEVVWFTWPPRFNKPLSLPFSILSRY